MRPPALEVAGAGKTMMMMMMMQAPSIDASGRWELGDWEGLWLLLSP